MLIKKIQKGDFLKNKITNEIIEVVGDMYFSDIFKTNLIEVSNYANGLKNYILETSVNEIEKVDSWYKINNRKLN